MQSTILADKPFRLWAKLPDKKEDSPAFHPLICHMLDVAVVARAMWQMVLSASACRRIAETMKLNDQDAEKWITYLAALHDLGKASPAFQLREEAKMLFPLYTDFGAPPRGIQAKDAPHGRVTAGELPALLVQQFKFDQELANRFAVIIGGHHGIFPTSDDLLRRYPKDGVGGGLWKSTRAELVKLFAELLNVPGNAVPQQLDHAAAMIIAGLVSVADWVGSNSDFFPYLVNDWERLPDITPSDYMKIAEAQAHSALKHLGWLGWEQPLEARGFDQLFPNISTPRPLQEAAISIADQLTGPGIVIIEAPMGEGKTEAALYLADHWGVVPGPRGCYMALPTQATSNQIFGRVRKFLESRYKGEMVLLQLLHGHAGLSAEFQTLRQNGDRLFKLDGVYSDDGCAIHEAMSVVAAEWFTHRKRGLLAPFGVGTIDQALLAVLQTKHVFVRLFGLAHKTVIVDEVHAYDAYMSKLLERLLEWLAALGSPVVLLSATLPAERQQALLNAYCRGFGHSQSQSTNESAIKTDYPRIRWATATTAGARQIAVSEQSARRLQIRWVNGGLPQSPEEPFALGEKLLEALANGGCAAVICNTVNRAQQVFRALQTYFTKDELDLFHARFLFTDRDRREKRARIHFGKEGEEVEIDDELKESVTRPHRAVLVATQVIEQSLDLDFDLMVTDIAPVDLVLQRSGRLHRHQRKRPDGLTEPTLWICQPEGISDDIPQFDSGTKAVYDEHILLRSWLTLGNRDSINIPADIEALIESIYGEQSCPETVSAELHDCWITTAQELKGKLKVMQAKAAEAIVPQPSYEDDILEVFNKRLEEDEPEIHASLQALTRLADPTVSVVCLHPNQHQQCDWPQSPDLKTARFLLEHSVNLSHRGLVQKLLRQEVPTAWQRSALLRHHRLIEMDASGVWNNGEYEIRLDSEIGVAINKL